jgi:hypothetical protein
VTGATCSFKCSLSGEQLRIAHRVLFDEFKLDCRFEAGRQWAYRELVDDHPERVVQSFELGELPAELIKWLGEKYEFDLPPTAG